MPSPSRQPRRPFATPLARAVTIALCKVGWFVIWYAPSGPSASRSICSATSLTSMGEGLAQLYSW